MTNIYIIDDNGETEPLKRIHCKDEYGELQRLLEKNPNLIPGDQINPEDPRRWLLIKREMPVPDPSTGSNRWSIDFLYADQDATPTFVECKRFNDTRSRREVVGQIFEYAANGHYYWTKELLEKYAEESSMNNGATLDEMLLTLQATNEDFPEAFFERFKENLREGQLRIIFFLEEAPVELKSVVGFLNKQMERSEILLVEAKQFEKNGSRIVVPTLFGYTEEARRIKRTVNISSGLPRRKWDKTLFFEEISKNLDIKMITAIKRLYEYSELSNNVIKWGNGAVNGTFSFACNYISPRSIFSVYSHNGSMVLNFGWIYGNEYADTFKEDFIRLLTSKMGLRLPELPKYPSVPIAIWGEKVDIFIEILEELLPKNE